MRGGTAVVWATSSAAAAFCYILILCLCLVLGQMKDSQLIISPGTVGFVCAIGLCGLYAVTLTAALLKNLGIVVRGFQLIHSESMDQLGDRALEMFPRGTI